MTDRPGLPGRGIGATRPDPLTILVGYLKESVERVRTHASTFSGKIAGFTAILLILTVCLTVVWASAVGRRQALAQVSAEMTELANSMADRLDRGMAARYRDVVILSRLDALRPVWTDTPDRIRPVLDALRAEFQYYAWIGVAEPDGKVRAATGRMLEGASVAQRPWFIEALKGPTVQDIHEAKLLAGLLGPSPSGEPFRFVDVAVPLRDVMGNPAGVLGAHLSWEWATDIRAEMLTGRPPGTDIQIIDRKGEVILGLDRGTVLPPEILAQMTGGEGSFIREGNPETLDGYARTRGIGAFPGFGWTVIAREPLDIALAPVHRLVLTIIAGGVAVALIGIALAALLAQRLAAPLRELTVAADAIGRGGSEASSMLPRALGSREIVRLSTALRSLLRRVGAAETQSTKLTQQIKEDARQHAAEISALQDLAMRDPLTGVLNRRALQEAGEQAMQRFRKEGRSFAVLVADIDYFKSVNDTYGHAAGDAVISMTAARLSRLVRDSDRVARVGGEEFVLLLEHISPDHVYTLAERIREEVGKAAIEAGDQTIRITLSLGGTAVDSSDRDLDDVIERADHALYDAKASGRNAVRLVWDPDRRGAA